MSLIKSNENGLFSTFDTMWSDLFNRDVSNFGLELGTSIPAVNTKETENSFKIEVAVPGFNKEDIHIDVDHNVMTLFSEKEEENEEKDGEKVTRREFKYDSFSRSFHIPENVDDEHIEAEYKDGILKLTLPKPEPSSIEPKKHIVIH